VLSACAQPAAGRRPEPGQAELAGGDNAEYRPTYQESGYLANIRRWSASR
jgi:hypothetical protein